MQTLDDEPLPDEAFAWLGIAEDIRAVVAETLTLCDGFCDEMAGVELRTACRRLLARAAGTGVFRRRARPVTAAAAICWIVVKDNDLIRWGGIQAKDLLAHFGLRGKRLAARTRS